ncbi:DUF1592 domain-containing protein [Bdellovibrio sp. HCB274]|uniref:DUF1592 domain-containing protein n=1 Tax=Bdellovibrio sp. HCB274 TaxID=3394361 RepID=UPI0039B6E04A
MKTTKEILLRSSVLSLSCLSLILFLSGCGQGFVVSKDLSSLSEADVIGSIEGNKTLDGQKIYSTNCAGCHGELSVSKIVTPTIDSITLNLANQPAMVGLKSSMTKEAISAVSAAITEARSVSLQCTTAPDVGFVSAQRLNRKEFDNTLTDLLGISTKYSSSFPPDGVTNGFANNALTLVITADLAEKIASAAESAIGEAFASAALKQRIFTCDAQQAACIQSTLQSFLTKAFRRPPDSEEMTRYTALVNTVKAKGETGEFALRVALTSALTSPHFLFRIPVLSNPSTTTAVALGPYQLASRLSYFLWSSMPDQELMNAAASGNLLKPDQLEVQVRRMLASTKATALVDNFVAPWIGLGKVERVTPDPILFPTFNETLRSDLMTETKMFIGDIFKRDASFFEMLTAKYSFLNDRLAAHYGISGVSGSAFQKMSFTDNKRMGFLTHGSMMAVGSNQYYSSIVKRGNLVLSNVLCSPPPPPPPGTVAVLTEEQIINNTRRDILKHHRENPACFSCHSQIDPIGLGFEHFDPLGRYVMFDEKNRALDSSSTMPNGKSFTDAVGMISIVSQDARFKSCVAEKMLIYSLGRNAESFDRCTINRIGQNMVDPNKPISQAIVEMVLSDPFRKQRGGGN